MEGNSPLPPLLWASTVKHQKKQPRGGYVLTANTDPNKLLESSIVWSVFSDKLYMFPSFFLGILNFQSKTVKTQQEQINISFLGKAAQLNRRHWKPAYPTRAAVKPFISVP